MIQDLVIKLDENKQPLSDEGESLPLLYVNMKAITTITPNASLSDERAIPEEVEQYGYGVFEWAYSPEVTHTQTAEAIGVTRHEDGIYRPTFSIREATQEEINSRTVEESAKVRNERNFFLERTDYTQLPNATAEFKEKASEWEVYRQALRDITAQTGFPFNVQWPEKPARYPS
jgi:hypothetical protein